MTSAPTAARLTAGGCKTFLKEIGRGPHQWGLISYPDVNKLQNKFTKQFLKDTRRGNVYVTEVGPINVFGRFYSQEPRSPEQGDGVHDDDLPRVVLRIKAMYIYHWRASFAKNASVDACSTRR